MIRVSEGIYEHYGQRYIVAEGGCSFCCLKEPTTCEFSGQGCSNLIGVTRHFVRLEEKQMIKENVSFKCVVPSRDVEEKIAKALYAKGLVPGGMIASIGACFMMFHSEGLNANSDAVKFCQWPQPLVSWQQALDLIATVQKPEPVFDIKLRDEVLVRDMAGDKWEIKHFAILREALSGHIFKTYGGSYGMCIRFAGNEKYHGTDDSPSGWWEVKNGKPKWVTRE